jgi:hypothetical protein
MTSGQSIEEAISAVLKRSAIGATALDDTAAAIKEATGHESSA